MPNLPYEWHLTHDHAYTAKFSLSYPYTRHLGATLSRFFTALRDRRIEATVGVDGAVRVPPAEFDPTTGTPCTQWTSVEPTGTVESWCWDPVHQHAWGLIKLDGASTSMIHRVDAPDATTMSTGMRVTARWETERVGSINDIAAFVAVAP